MAHVIFTKDQFRKTMDEVNEQNKGDTFNPLGELGVSQFVESGVFFVKLTSDLAAPSESSSPRSHFTTATAQGYFPSKTLINPNPGDTSGIEVKYPFLTLMEIPELTIVNRVAGASYSQDDIILVTYNAYGELVPIASQDSSNCKNAWWLYIGAADPSSGSFSITVTHLDSEGSETYDNITIDYDMTNSELVTELEALSNLTEDTDFTVEGGGLPNDLLQIVAQSSNLVSVAYNYGVSHSLNNNAIPRVSLDIRR